MAKIPDGTALGERVPPRTGGSQYIGRAPQIAAAGAIHAAEALGDVVTQFARQDDAFNFARARNAMLGEEAAIRKELETNQEWQTHEQRFTERMKKKREEMAPQIRGARSRTLFEQESEADILRGLEGVRANARRVEGVWGRSQLDDMLETNRRAALESQDPAQRDQLMLGTLDAITGARDKGYINPEQAVAARQAWTSAYGEGFVAMQSDAEQLKMLRKPKGTPADFIDPAKRAVLIDRLEEKQRVVADRREARAERAVAQMERQIASGVPWTDDMLKDWKQVVAGTSMQGELDGLLRDEREVQATLRKPISEQIRLVQEKDAALKTGGGSIAQAANVERLRGAVQKNIAMLQTAPALYLETRMNEANTPIDVAAFADPARLMDAGATLQERAVKIRGLERTVGAPVPMLPLLPQEAQTLAALIDKSSAAQAAQTFAGLREAAGSADVFRGAMQQIAADSPVKALAGMRAGSDGGAPVATTMLEGERLLNPGKGDKAADGKPQAKSIYLPDSAALQEKFADVAGDAFAGRPQAADAALQAVRAYYTGRAAQTGRVAADDKDVDDNLVREAVEATLGAVVDYNGEGSVLAPWGMPEDEFEDRAERAVAAKIRELGLPAELDADSVGLSNAGAEGQYAVTLGRNLLLDAQGRPILVDIRRPTAARGVINRGAP